VELFNHYKNDPRREGGGKSLIKDRKRKANSLSRGRRRRRRRRRRREFNQRSFRGKPTRCRVVPGRPALLGWRGTPAPQGLLR